MTLKFGPLKIFQKSFVQMSDTIFMTNQNFHHTFPMESHKSVVSTIALFRTCNGAKPHMFIVNTFTITTNHMVS